MKYPTAVWSNGGYAAVMVSWLEGLFEDVESAVRDFAADGQGWEDHDNICFGGDEQAVFSTGIANLGGVVLIFDFNADGEAFAADGGFALKTHLREPGEKVLAELGSVFEKLILVARQIREVGQGGGHGARVPTIRGIEAEVFLDGLCYFGRGDHGAQAAVAATDGLGHAQDIGLEIKMLAGKELSGPAKTRGYFVGDEEGAVAGAKLADAADELVLGDDGAEVANDRLHDEGSNVAFL